MSLPRPDLQLGDDGDLDLSNGDGRMAVNVRQDVQIRLRFVKGEHFRDVTVGTPYIGVIVGVKAPRIGHVAALLRNRILNTRGVLSLEAFDLDYNAAARKLTVDWRAQTQDGPISGTQELGVT